MSEMLLADARLSSPPSERMIRYHDLPGLEREKKQFKEFVAVDLAHTIMLSEQGIIDPAVGGAIVEQLLLLNDEQGANFPVDVRKGSFLLQMEANLSRAIGEDIAGQMHTGRSRIDQGATVRRLYKRNRMLSVMDRINDLREVINIKAQQHQNTIMPGYTHMQQAQPWVFGHYLLSFSSRLHDSFERLSETYARVNLSPLGAVGLAGTSWPLNRVRTQKLLGFDGLVENSKLGREAYYAAELISALSFVMADLNDLATDLHIWSSTEFGMVECHDSYCGTSSIFPQKKNPTALETIKKAAGTSVTWLATALATFRAEGTGDQAVRELPFIDDALSITEGMLDLCAGVVETLIVDKKRMQSLLEGSWCTASNLADIIVREKKMSFREVHHIVGRVVRNAMASHTSPQKLTGKLLDDAAIETIGHPLGFEDETVREALNPVRFVKSRTTDGGVAPEQVERLTAQENKKLLDGRHWMEDARARLSHARQSLESAACQLVKQHMH